MSDLLAGAGKAFEELRRRHPDLTLFAILQPADEGGQWDVVVSAPSMAPDLESYRRVGELLQRFLSPADMAEVDRVVVLDPLDPVLKAPLPRMSSGTGPSLTASRFHFGDVRVTRGHFFAAPPKRKVTPRKSHRKIA